MESVESRPKRQAAKLAEEIIRQELAREEAKMQAQGKQSVPDSEKPDRSPEEQAAARSVTVLGGLFKCETATEDSQMVRSFFVSPVLVPFLTFGISDPRRRSRPVQPLCQRRMGQGVRPLQARNSVQRWWVN